MRVMVRVYGMVRSPKATLSYTEAIAGSQYALLTHDARWRFWLRTARFDSRSLGSRWMS